MLTRLNTADLTDQQSLKMHLVIRVLLALHITGIVIMAGTILIDYLTFNTFWKLAEQGDSRSFGLLMLMARYGAFVRAGAITIIFTGITMLILQKGILWQQLRFKFKMGLVLLLIVNGILVGNRQSQKLRDTIATDTIDFIQRTIEVRETLDRFYMMQLTLFFLIILVSVVKLNKPGS